MRAGKLMAALFAMALLVAACGGGDGGETESEAAGSEAAPAGSEAAGSSEAAGGADASDVRTAMVTDVGGLGDNSFNDSANAGLERAESELGADINVLESSAPTDYVNNLTQLAESGFSPVFAVGFLMADAVAEVAPQFPDTQFAIVDFAYDEPIDNVASAVFQEEQGSYLAGVVAGLMTQQDTDYTTAAASTVGFLGGQESPLIRKFEAGYIAGVESVCPDCEILSEYAGTTPDAFNDPAAGQEIALRLNDDGADIIYHASGATGSGMFEVATERQFFGIGVDIDQAALFPDAPVLTSMLKRVDNAVFQTVEDFANDEFPGGEVQTFGLEEEGIDLAPFGQFDDVVPQEVKDAVDQARTDIIDGAVEVPTEPAG
jgi:basic membrane protein A and related proteins